MSNNKNLINLSSSKNLNNNENLINLNSSKNLNNKNKYSTQSKYSIQNKGFTLIEVIIAISILGLIMVSVFAIFNVASDLNNKADISRSMQENIKNIVQILNKDIEENKIYGVGGIVNSCDVVTSSKKFTYGNSLCLGKSPNQIKYYLAKKDSSGGWAKIEDTKIKDECKIGKESCFLVKDDGTNKVQVSNSWIEFRSLDFYISSSDLKKVTINFQIQPSTKKGIKMPLIQNNILNFQTTISQNLYNEKEYK